jgi:hypothetical protein
MRSAASVAEWLSAMDAQLLTGAGFYTRKDGMPRQGCQMVGFLAKKSKFGYILEGLAMEDVGIFYGHLVHFTVLCYILWVFGIVCGNLVYFPHFGILYQEKSGSPVPRAGKAQGGWHQCDPEPILRLLILQLYTTPAL